MTARPLINDFLEKLGVPPPGNLDEYVEHDGSLVLVVRDNAIRVRYSDAVNGFLLTGVVLETHGMSAEDVVGELLLLNGRLEHTAGLVFGMLDTETVVATCCVPAPFATADVLAETTLALAESVETWRELLSRELRRRIAQGGESNGEEYYLQGVTPV